MTQVRLIVALLALLVVAPIAKGQNATVAGGNTIFTEVAPDAPAIVSSAQDAGLIDTGMVIRGLLDDRYDVDMFRVCSLDSATYRLFVQTPYTNLGGRPYTSTLHVFYEDGRPWQPGMGPADDLRARNHLSLAAGECATVGVSNEGDLEVRENPKRVVMTQPSNSDGQYEITVFADFPTTSVQYLAQREIYSILDGNIETLDCSFEAFSFPYDADQGVMRTILHISESCAGFKVRMISTVQGDCAQLQPDGSVVDLGWVNVRWLDYPQSYPPAAPHQDAVDPSGYCEEPLIPDNFLAVGTFAYLETVRDDDQPSDQIRVRPSSNPVRQGEMIGLLIKPGITWSADHPFRFGEDSWAEIRWTGSRQIDAVEVHLPEYGVTQVVPLHEPGDYAWTWSATAPEDEEFMVRYELPANMEGGTWPPTRGSQVNYVLTPLGIDGHSVRGRMDHLATSGATSVATEGEGDLPQAFALEAVYPNPTAGKVTVDISIEAAQFVKIEVFDALGRRVRVVSDGLRLAGDHHLRLDFGDLPLGLYLIRATGEGRISTRRIVVMR